MRKLISFMVVTLDGYYEGPDGEFDWPNVDDEFNEFAISQLDNIDTLVFGRATYEGMASYWPTPAALEDDPAVAGRSARSTRSPRRAPGSSSTGCRR